MSLLNSMIKASGSILSFNGVMTGYFAMDSYQEAKREGKGTAGALGSAAMSAVLPMTMGILPWMGFELVTSAPGMAASAYGSLSKYRRELGQKQRHIAFQNASFQENQQTYTMRQAALAIAERTRYNRSLALQGHEAKYMFK